MMFFLYMIIEVPSNLIFRLFYYRLSISSTDEAKPIDILFDFLLLVS